MKSSTVCLFAGSVCVSALCFALLAGGGAATCCAIDLQSAPATSIAADFKPDRFTSEAADSMPPVLRIHPGQLVRVSVPGRLGVDGVVPSSPSGSLVGPFFVEGAGPGDTLVLHVSHVEASGRTAFQRGEGSTPSTTTRWNLDPAAAVARLVAPGERMNGYSARVEPYLGFVAVAPSGHARASADSTGSFGGSLSYRGVAQNAALYLPVYAEGALLFLGDGSLAPSDGSGTTPFSSSVRMEFTVSVRKGAAPEYPRLRRDESLIAFGSGKSLSEAARVSTTQLMKWLTTEYGLTADDASLALGALIQYDIATVSPPVIVARLQWPRGKEVLPAPQARTGE